MNGTVFGTADIYSDQLFYERNIDATIVFAFVLDLADDDSAYFTCTCNVRAATRLHIDGSYFKEPD